MIRNNRQFQNAFTLVELALVILIIAALIVGVTAGTNLINQARLRSVISDFLNYETAFLNFRTQNKSIPGDFGSAFAIWGTSCATIDALCDGNENQIIDFSLIPTNNEVNKAWKHLQLAGTIDANINPVTTAETIIGENAPYSKVSSAGYVFIGGNGDTGTLPTPFTVSDNALYIGREAPLTSLFNSALKPYDAYQIDHKFDDGDIDPTTNNFIGANTGRVRVIHGNDVTGTDCVSDETLPLWFYNISNNIFACRMGYLVQDN